MQTLLRLSLFQYRLYPHESFGFEAPLTAITGPNGSGKTALLDAVYYLCYTKSYFTAQQQSIARWGSPGFKLSGIFQSPEGREEEITCRWEAGKKELFCNGSPYERPTDHIGRYGAVMIAPDDGELLLGGSELRRKWVDGILAQTNAPYLDHLLQYTRLLQQRNAWLKAQALMPSGNRIELESYDARMAVHGTYLYEKRRAFLETFLPLLSGVHRRLVADAEPVAVHYLSDVHEKPLAQWFTERFGDDLRMQRTTRGIHRDDWEFRIQEKPVRPFASQGQRKTLLFALKLAQYQYLRAQSGRAPILLLDDVFEKLDQVRIEALLSVIREEGFGQVLLTDTHVSRIREVFGPEAVIQFVETR